MPLSKAGEYEALSYHWQISRGDTILVNGRRTDVTGNLFNALLHLRHADRPRALWVDAICINQDDDREKGEQIRLMRAIYQQGRRTVAWFGLEDGGTHMLGAFVEWVLHAKQAIESTDDWIARDDKRFYRLSAEDRMTYDIPDDHHVGYASLQYLLSRSWTRRIWTIQEVAVAGDTVIQCGPYTFSMRDIAYALSFVLGLGLGPRFTTRLSTTWFERISQQEGRRRKLLSLVKQHWRCEATKAHDKIYALCGLACDAGPDGLNIQFQYNKSGDEVYTDFARAVICKYRSLDILSCLASFSEDRSSGLPSWVPDWRVWNPQTIVYGKPDLENGTPGPCNILFAATKDSVADPTFDADSQELQLWGYIIDTIKEVGRCRPFHHTTSSGLSLIFNWRSVAKCRKRKRYKHTGQPRVEAFYDTCTMGNVGGILDDPAKQYGEFDEKLHNLAILWSPWATCDQINSASELVKEEDVWGSVVEGASAVTINRRLIRTRKDYLGLVHGQAQKGDKLALLKGGRLPVIIRKRGTKWKLVGDGYIHGIMMGELFKERKCKPLHFV